jgi:hypothetical protein
MAASQMRFSEGVFLHVGVAGGIAEHLDQHVQYGLLLTRPALEGFVRTVCVRMMACNEPVQSTFSSRGWSR